MKNLRFYIGWGFIKNEDFEDFGALESSDRYQKLMTDGIFWDITERLTQIPDLEENLEINYIYTCANDLTIKAENFDKFFDKIFTPLVSPEGFDKYGILREYFEDEANLVDFRWLLENKKIKQLYLFLIQCSDKDIYRGIIPYEINFDVTGQRTVAFKAYNLIKWLQMRKGSVCTRKEDWSIWCKVIGNAEKYRESSHVRHCVFLFQGNAGTTKPPNLFANREKLYIYWNGKYYNEIYNWEPGEDRDTKIVVRPVYYHSYPYELIGYDVLGGAVIKVKQGEKCPIYKPAPEWNIFSVREPYHDYIKLVLMVKDSTLEYIRTAILANLVLPQPSHKWFRFRQQVTDDLGFLSWGYRLPVNWQNKSIYDMLLELCKVSGGRFFISFSETGETIINVVNREYAHASHYLNTAWLQLQITKQYLNEGKTVEVDDEIDLGDIIRLEDDEPHPESIDKFIYYQGHWRKLSEIYQDFFSKPFIKFNIAMPYFDYIKQKGTDVFLGDAIYINGKYAGIVVRTIKRFNENLIEIETETVRKANIYDE